MSEIIAAGGQHEYENSNRFTYLLCAVGWRYE